MEHQIGIQDLLCGRTFQEPSVPTREKTSMLYFSRLPISAKKDELLYLDLRNLTDGVHVETLWVKVGALPGESMTLNFGESPSEERESTLSAILDLNAPDKYSLSPKACAGILRRAEKRGKILPDMLKEALMEVVGCDG